MINKINFILLLMILFFSANLYSQEKSLPIPPIITGPEIDLKIQNGTLNLNTGSSKTMGYNGNYLGPTIIVNKNDFIRFKINNTLNEDTTVHWHGLLVPAEYDGGPLQKIKKRTVWEPQFEIIQSAATLWYHPHLMGKTGEHVYNGLAGLFIINDNYSKSLNLPMNYGINDIPIILQDRQIDRNGKFIYGPNMHEEVFGYIGNIMLVNGELNPKLEIRSGTYRFRILNGSNSSLYRIRFADDKSFTVIASDGGFLAKTVNTNELIISPGERYEILSDFDKNEATFLIVDIYGGSTFQALKISTNDQTGKLYDHPKNFDNEVIEYNLDENTKREFLMETGMMGRFTINGKSMSLSRIDFRVPKKEVEIWTIKNVGMGMMQVPHSFHVHDTQFNIISVNGKKPSPLYSGAKDTVLVMPGDSVNIALKFIEYTGQYMYHCHFLEHEDNGMMGQFIVE